MSLALATLEYFVNLDASPPQEMKLISIQAHIPKILVKTAENLPDGWNKQPVSQETQIYGSQWINERISAVLKVPSAVIPNEFNYLLNPTHSDFSEIKINPPLPFSLDANP